MSENVDAVLEDDQSDDESLTDREVEIYKTLTKSLKRIAGPYYPLIYLGASATQSWMKAVDSFKKEGPGDMKIISQLASTSEEIVNYYARKNDIAPEEAIEIAYRNNLPKEYHGAAKILTKRIMEMPWDDTIEMGMELLKEMPWDDYTEKASDRIKKYGRDEGSDENGDEDDDEVRGGYRNTKSVLQDIINKYLKREILGMLVEG